MILKVIKEFTNEEGKTSPITEYYSGKQITINKGVTSDKKPLLGITVDEEMIILKDESGKDEIDNPYTIKVEEVYLMNNDGKTIEKIDVKTVFAFAEWEIASK